MSGRLIILPKKSYCPWKAENVERVLRDERLEKERQEKEAAAIAETQSEQRLTLLRKRRGIAVPIEEPRHVNLFQSEEDECLKSVTVSKEERRKVGIMPVVLGSSELKARGERRPFYLRDAAQVEDLCQKETKRKDSMDPMKQFSSKKAKRRRRTSTDELVDEDSKRRRKQHKKHHRGDTNKQRSKSTVDELRRRRQEREASESKREKAVRSGQIGLRSQPYQDQFNPGLSRK